MDPQSTQYIISIDPKFIFKNYFSVNLGFEKDRYIIRFNVYYILVYKFKCVKNEAGAQSWVITDPDDKKTYWLEEDVTPVLKEVIGKHLGGVGQHVDSFNVENLPFPLDFLPNDISIDSYLIQTDHCSSPTNTPTPKKLTQLPDDDTHYLTSGEITNTRFKTFYDKLYGEVKLLDVQHFHRQCFGQFDEVSADNLATVIREIQKSSSSYLKWRFSASCLLTPFDMEAVLCHVAEEFRSCATWKYQEAMSSRGLKRTLNFQLNDKVELNVLVDSPMRMDELPRLVLQVQRLGTATPHPPLFRTHHQLVHSLRPHFLKFTTNLELQNPNSPPRFTKAVLNWTLAYLDWLIPNVLLWPIFIALMYWVCHPELPVNMNNPENILRLVVTPVLSLWVVATMFWYSKLSDRHRKFRDG